MTQQPNVYELLGRKEVELAQKQAAADAAFGIIRALKEGKLSLDEIEMTSDGLKAGAPVVAPEPVEPDNGAKPRKQKVRK